MSFSHDDARSRAPARVATIVTVLAAAACGPPQPPSAQELLQKKAPPMEVSGSGGFAVGSTVSFGDTAVRVESSSRAAPGADLTRASVDDALAMIASSAEDVEKLAGDVHATSAAVAKGELRVDVRAASAAGEARASATIEVHGKAADRVREQADLVSRGAEKVREVASMVAGAAELAQALGKLFGDKDDDTVVKLAADTRGRPFRGTCSFKNQGTLDQRPAISCTFVRADVPPATVWHLNVGTSLAGGGGLEVVPASRGWLRAEPEQKGRPAFWILRPDTTTPFFHRTMLDYASFAVQRDTRAIARLQVATSFGPTSAWMTTEDAGLEPEARDAVSVALGILALAPWPRVEPKDSSSSS